MPRGRSASSFRSESSDIDIDGIADTEMVKLQRQFRIMEGDRKAYSIQSQELIRKQRVEIERLRKEQDELQKSLGASKSASRRQQDSEDAEQLRSHLTQKDEVEEQMEKERQNQADLQQEMSEMHRKLEEVRRGEVSIAHSLTDKANHTQKATRTLENKLDRALTRFSEQLTRNSRLREELETLRVERLRFQQLHRRLEKELLEIRRDIGDVISMSTAAYDARVEAQTKMTMLKEKAVKDLVQYSAEMKELERVIAHERRLKEFMSTKCNERSTQDEGQDIGSKQEMKDQRRTESGEDSAETLQEVFCKIRSVTGEDDLDVLVTKFIQVEDRNFALFNYVNEQNNHAEALRDEINQTKEELEQFRLAGQQQEEEHHVVLREVEEQQREAQAQAQEHEALANAVSKILDQIKTGVNSLFQQIDCDRAVLEDLLGSSSGIRDNNIMTYLGQVEQRANELLTVQAYVNSKDLDQDYDPKEVAQVLLGQNPELQKQNISIQPPVTRDDYDTEESPLTDEDERPLTQEELRQRILKGVLRREGGPRSSGGRDVKASRISTILSSRLRVVTET
ncbi:coiled-coil domain-containing protein 114 [Clupea harengus]|uniref:Coiled-coil domain-containing protein 114 n=1 Tax=Clupea harengus TaxID=7950 RepID=A0A6P3WBP0_CLUHA|nr:coiled-coil domain-containing protein 114 [Clupea harengus]